MCMIRNRSTCESTTSNLLPCNYLELEPPFQCVASTSSSSRALIRHFIWSDLFGLWRPSLLWVVPFNNVAFYPHYVPHCPMTMLQHNAATALHYRPRDLVVSRPLNTQRATSIVASPLLFHQLPRHVTAMMHSIFGKKQWCVLLAVSFFPGLATAHAPTLF